MDDMARKANNAADPKGPDGDSKYVSVSTFAEMLGVSRERARDYVVQGRIKAEIVGNVYGILRADARAFKRLPPGQQSAGRAAAAKRFNNPPAAPERMGPRKRRKSA